MNNRNTVARNTTKKMEPKITFNTVEGNLGHRDGYYHTNPEIELPPVSLNISQYPAVLTSRYQRYSKVS